MSDVVDWLVRAGLLALILGFAYREFQTWRTRSHELQGLLFLLDAEVGYNCRGLSILENHPDYISEPLGEPVRTTIWDENRVRLSQLMKSRTDFRELAIHYTNLEDVLKPVLDTERVGVAAKHEFVARLLPDMQKQAQEARDTIRKYISPPREEFGLPFDVIEEQEQRK